MSSVASVPSRPPPSSSSYQWTLSYPGFTLTLMQDSPASATKLHFSAEGMPAFSLRFDDPFPSRFIIVLPGDDIMVRVIGGIDVGVWRFNERYSQEEEKELDHVCHLVKQVKEMDEDSHCRCTVISRGSTLFGVEVSAGLFVELDEAVVLLSLLKKER